jgi:hypothetical protein
METVKLMDLDMNTMCDPRNCLSIKKVYKFDTCYFHQNFELPWFFCMMQLWAICNKLK